MNGVGWAGGVIPAHTGVLRTGNSRAEGRWRSKNVRLIREAPRGVPLWWFGDGGPFVGFGTDYPQQVGFTLLIPVFPADRLKGELVRHSDYVKPQIGVWDGARFVGPLRFREV
jgi:hypothetical protein